MRDNNKIRRWLRSFTKAEFQPQPVDAPAKGADARMGGAELVRRDRLLEGGSSSEGGVAGSCAGLLKKGEMGCVLNADVVPPSERASTGLRHMQKVALPRSAPASVLLQRRQERSAPMARQNSSPVDVLGAALKRRAEGPTAIHDGLEDGSRERANEASGEGDLLHRRSRSNSDERERARVKGSETSSPPSQAPARSPWPRGTRL